MSFMRKPDPMPKWSELDWRGRVGYVIAEVFFDPIAIPFWFIGLYLFHRYIY